MNRRWLVIVAVAAIVGLMILPAVAMAAELSGTVKSVDTAKKSVVVTSDGKDHTVTWNDRTDFTVGDKKGSPADVRVGVKVTVSYEGGKASRIAVAK
jgi:hypothetical protein